MNDDHPLEDHPHADGAANDHGHDHDHPDGAVRRVLASIIGHSHDPGTRSMRR